MAGMFERAAHSRAHSVFDLVHFFSSDVFTSRFYGWKQSEQLFSGSRAIKLTTCYTNRCLNRTNPFVCLSSAHIELTSAFCRDLL